MAGKGQDAWIAKLRDALRELPQDYASSKPLAEQLSHAFHDELAKAIAPRLKAKLESMPRTTYAERQNVASWCNHELHQLRLCVRCPTSGRSAILVADLGGKAGEYSRFRLSVRDAAGRSHRTWSSKELPEPFELMEDAPRREGRSHWEGRPRTRE